MADWFYAKDNTQQGPISLAALQQLVQTGAVAHHDLVWTDGMQAWLPADRVPGLFLPTNAGDLQPPPAIGSQGPVSELPVAAIAYYAGAIPPRATEALRGYARPTGDVGTWPLNDAMVQQWTDTLRTRRPISSAAGLYRLLMALSLIFVVVAIFMALAAAGGGRRRGGEAVAILAASSIYLAGAILFFFLWRGTQRNQRWAPLTFSILTVVSLAFAWVVVLIAVAGGSDGSAFLGLALGSILPVIFLIVSGRAFVAIPRYLAQPAWCQELVARAKI